MDNFYDQAQKVREQYLKNPDNNLKMRLLSQLVAIAFLNNDKLPKNVPISIRAEGALYNFEVVELIAKRVLSDLSYEDVFIFEDKLEKKTVYITIYS